MSAVDWQKTRALFERVLDVPASERASWLAEQCGDDASLRGELDSLLAAHSTPSEFFDSGGEQLRAGLVSPCPGAEVEVGREIGPYRLLGLLGEGGMGQVYLAERVDGQFRQQVALKLMRAEFGAPLFRERFMREREILARLNHPNIAHLYDGGVADDGSPYFTLEHVPGAPLIDWCDARRLTIAARVALMLEICGAVEHAHRNLIVHRDIKPANILVTEDGRPKLLDFGIAKLLDQDAAPGITATHLRMMTREYAAPEQILSQPITTATDVYALGFVLYELLSGRRPYPNAEYGDVSWPKAIVEEPAEPLHRAATRNERASDTETLAQARAETSLTLRRRLRGDLDRIVRRALEKSPDARYPGVNAFADDLGAWLEHRPLRAGGKVYRAVKFARRNWLPFSAAAMTLLAVLAAAVGIAWESRQQRLAAEHALRESRTSTAVKDFLLALFGGADPNITKGREVTVREVVDRGVQRLNDIPPDQVELKSELETVLGRIYYQLGHYVPAAALHEQAFKALDASRASAAPLLAATAERYWAIELASEGALDEAQARASDAARRIEALPHASPADTAQALATAGWVALKRSDGGLAQRISAQLLQLAQRPPADDKRLALALDQQANALWLLHDYAGAARVYRKTFELDRRLYGADDERTFSAEHAVASALYSHADYAAAAEAFRRTVEDYARVFGSDHERTLNALEGLALVRYEAGDYMEARKGLEHVLAAQQAHARDDAETAQVLLNLGLVLADIGDLDRAEHLLQAARAFYTRPGGAALDPALTETISDLGYVSTLRGHLDEAERDLRDALKRHAASADSDTAFDLARLSDVRRLRGDVAQALSFGRGARDAAVTDHSERSRQAGWSHHVYALALLADGDHDDAEHELRASLASFAALLPPDGAHPLAASPRLALGELIFRDGKREEALQLAREALDINRRTFGENDKRTRKAHDVVSSMQVVRASSEGRAAASASLH